MSKRHPDRGSCTGSCRNRHRLFWFARPGDQAGGMSGEAFTVHEHQFQDQVSKGRLVDALACRGDEGRGTLR